MKHVTTTVFASMTSWSGLLNLLQRLVALVYAYGAVVHVVNLLGFGPSAPPDRQMVFRSLDVVFLIIDVIVVVGLWRHRTWGVVAFFFAAAAQLVMYLGFTDYFAIDQMFRGRLMGLVLFHILTATLMGALLLIRHRQAT